MGAGRIEWRLENGVVFVLLMHDCGVLIVTCCCDGVELRESERTIHNYEIVELDLVDSSLLSRSYSLPYLES